MFCRLCHQHKNVPKRGVGKRPFIETGCQHYQVDYLDKHLNATMRVENLIPHSYKLTCCINGLYLGMEAALSSRNVFVSI